jgi:hypothetical protein
MTRPVPLSTARIQSELLDTDETLLAYSLGEDRSFLWRVTPQELQSEVLPGRSELETLSRDFYQVAVETEMLNWLASALSPEVPPARWNTRSSGRGI